MSGGALLALLTVYALSNSLSVVKTDMPEVKAFDEARFDARIDAIIDQELSESLGMPELMTSSPYRSPLETVSDSTLTIDFPNFICDWGVTQPTPRNPFDPPGGRYWEQAPRQAPARMRVVTSTGPDATAAAVAAALEWLTLHQQPDGGWSFAHQAKGCDENCTHAGTLAECRTGATALALLPYLGAGQTHKTGKYKKQVEAGLYFLTQQLKVTVQDGAKYGDLNQGGEGIHAQAISTLVLCEAYANSFDKGLMVPSQLALDQLQREPAALDDGWRWMALYSGHLAYMQVELAVTADGDQLLPAALNDLNQYQSVAASRRQKTIAVGVLSKMYVGWQKDDPLIARGLNQLVQWGPSSGDLDYRYFATQSLRNSGGDAWIKWHTSLRNQLVNSQEKKGHAKGSWHLAEDDGAAAGGRLYCTALSAAILEVYYRHLPVYGQVDPAAVIPQGVDAP